MLDTIGLQGLIPDVSADILRKVGDWLRRNGEFLAASERSPFGWVNWGDVTVRGHTVYLHLFRSVGRTLCHAELRNKVIAARQVEGNRTLRFEQLGDRIFVHDLPDAHDPIATVIALEVEGDPAPITPQSGFWIPGEEP